MELWSSRGALQACRRVDVEASSSEALRCAIGVAMWRHAGTLEVWRRAVGVALWRHKRGTGNAR